MPFFMPQLAFSPVRARCYAPAPVVSAPQSYYIRQQRPSVEQSFLPFLSLLDDAVNEINKAASRHHQQQQQQARRVLKTRFDARETAEAYHIEGELPGFEQDDLDIQFTDDQTLVIKGRSERQVEKPLESAPEAKKIEEPASVEESSATLTPEAEQEQAQEQQQQHSETSSVKSYQATVEDDFEDLANDSDVGSTVSQQEASISSVDKGKQRATVEDEVVPDPPVSDIAEQQQQQQTTQTSHNLVSERSFGSFTRTFKFPVRVNTNAAKASLRNGILTLTVPKAPVPEVRRIWIQ